MFIAGLETGTTGPLGSSMGARRGRRRAPWSALALGTTVFVGLLVGGAPAEAAIVPTVSLGTSAQYAVLGGSTVTNTGGSVLDGSLGLWPGTSITGFPPGLVLAPGTTENTSPAAQQAQTDLTAAYVDAAGRPLDATTAADLVNLTLVGGVYAGPGKSPLSLSGPLVLDGAGDPTSVFIFQTDSTLITASSSTVTLINGAQECNVFWLVGSSATLGTNSVFAGNILALDSITVTNGVVVHGRALARNAAVTLDNDTFTRPTCDTTTPVPTTTTAVTATTDTSAVTTTPPGATTVTTTPGTSPGGAVTTTPGGTGSTTPGGTGSTTPGGEVSTTTPAGFDVGSTTPVVASTSPTPSFPGVTLPRTGAGPATAGTLLFGALVLALGVVFTGVARRRPASSR